jgi:hypothetical protein
MTLDRGNRIVTTAACVLVSAVAVGQCAIYCVKASRLAFAPALILGPLLLVAWAMAPCELAIVDGEIRVGRRAWAPLCVPLSALASVERIDGLGPGTIRVLGVGGFFGSYGLFRNRALGQFRAYVTRRGPAVLIRRLEGRPLLVTPDDVSGAIVALHRAGVP